MNRSALRKLVLPALGAVALGLSACEDPSEPQGPFFPFVEIAAGREHSCAFTDIGVAACWGRGASGALGNGSLDAISEPRRVDGDHTFTRLSGGSNHTCASKGNGEAFCWGSDARAQLGTNSGGDRNVPTLVEGGLAFADVSAGGEHSCGLTSDGEVRCWGWNFFGQLGTGLRIDLGSPSDAVSVGEAFVDASAGEDFSCAVTEAGAAYCWGRNDRGQLGSAVAPVLCENEFVSAVCSPTPVRVPAPVGFTAISAGDGHACALTADGAAWCWGEGSTGELGNGARPDVSGPVRVAGSARFAEISAAADHTCGLDQGGSVLCWGHNGAGRLGTGDAPNSIRDVPAAIASDLQFSGVSAGRLHTCAVTVVERRQAYCWGFGEFGQLGHGIAESSAVPVRVERSGTGA